MVNDKPRITAAAVNARNMAEEIEPAAQDRTVAALVTLAQYGVPPDMQECLVHGNERLGIRPGALAATLAATHLAGVGVEAHSDDLAVDRFAAAMKLKLAQKRAEGRGGWDNPGECSIEWLSKLLRSHVEKADPVDVGNFAMMIHQRGGRINK